MRDHDSGGTRSGVEVTANIALDRNEKKKSPSVVGKLMRKLLRWIFDIVRLKTSWWRLTALTIDVRHRAQPPERIWGGFLTFYSPSRIYAAFMIPATYPVPLLLVICYYFYTHSWNILQFATWGLNPEGQWVPHNCHSAYHRPRPHRTSEDSALTSLMCSGLPSSLVISLGIGPIPYFVYR
jgi:hypothetical protein